MFFSFLFPLCGDAQKAAKVKSFTLTNDHIPSSDRRKDLKRSLVCVGENTGSRQYRAH